MSTAMPALLTHVEFGSRTFWALLPVFVLVLSVVGYALVDLLRARQVRYLPKPVWALIIVLASAPLGALAYLFLGRTRHEADRADQVSSTGENGDPGRPDSGTGERVGLAGRHLSKYERGIRL